MHADLDVGDPGHRAQRDRQQANPKARGNHQGLLSSTGGLLATTRGRPLTSTSRRSTTTESGRPTASPAKYAWSWYWPGSSTASENLPSVFGYATAATAGWAMTHIDKLGASSSRSS